MKKSLLALAVLTAATGVAQAASSVTLYGKVETAYQSATGDGLSVLQGAAGESRVGIKVNEDLGNGMAAFAHLEAKFDADTGASNGDNFFGEKSVVGLSFANGLHSLYFGRSASPMDRFGYSDDHLASGLGWKSSAGNWANGAYYDYNGMNANNGLVVHAGATTKGGYAGNANEGVGDNKMSYGLTGAYRVNPNWVFGLGYQVDNDASAVKNEWGVGTKFTFNPVSIALSYASAKLGATHALAPNAKERRIHTTISAMVTPADKVYVNYLNNKINGYSKEQRFGLGYIHSLSKRTELFANAGYRKTNFVAGGSTKSKLWDVGMRHSF